MKWAPVPVRVALDALNRFSLDDGWAMASHVALSSLMALFPFLVFAAALAGFLGVEGFVDSILPFIFDSWPKEIADPLAREIRNVLVVQRGGLLTLSAVIAAFFASNGVEAVRVSLNRAYRLAERRSMLHLRGQSLLFVLIGVILLVAVTFLLIAAPIALAILDAYMPDVSIELQALTVWRHTLASAILVTGLAAAHLWLPAQRRSVSDIWPGIVLTIGFWLAGSAAFVFYLERFARYAATYAGLASIVATLVFLYMVSAIFIFGGELNAAIMRHRRRMEREGGETLPLPPPQS